MLVCIGLACAVGLIVLSAAVNYRVGFRRADTALDGYIYGIGLALMDVFKALCPFYVHMAWRQRQWLGVAAGSVLFGVATIASLQAGLEFASEMRGLREGSRSVAGETRAGLTAEIKRVEQELARLGNVRSRGEVASALRAVRERVIPGAGTVASVSSDCTANRRVTREACEEFRQLEQELARAERRENVIEGLAQTRKKLEQLGDRGVVVDPQLDTVTGVLGWFGAIWERDAVRLGLLLLVSLVFELGSGLGMYVAMLPWIGRTEERRGGMTEPIVEEAVRLGSVETFAVEVFEQADGAWTSVGDVFDSYKIWCVARKEAPLGETSFLEELKGLTDEVGIEQVGEGRGARLHDVRMKRI